MRTLWTALGLAMTTSSCLIPMPIEEEPAPVNLPPFFEFSQAQPPLNQVVRYAFDPESEDSTVELRINSVEDPNPDDRLFYRWFVNYNGRFIANEGPSAGFSPQARDRPIAYRFDPCLVLNPPDPNGNNRIELIVADRPFVSREDQEPGTPNPDQVLPEGAGSFHVTWILRFVASDGPGACPN